MEKIRIGVIGVGKLGSLHAKIYNQMSEVELVGVCDTDINHLKKIASLYNVKPYLEHKKLIKNVDAISIAVPTSKHFDIAKACLMHNIHILIEKPITSTLEEAYKLIQLTRETNSIVQVGHIERFNAAVKAIYEMPETPRFIECHRLGPYTKRGTDVSVTVDLMIHDIDIILTLVKSKIKKIDAVGVEVLSDKNDIVNARITFENETVANLTSSRVSKEIVRKIRIFQKQAYISLDYVNQKALLYRKQNNKITQTQIKVEEEEPLKAELKSFIRCIKEKKDPVVSILEATKALETAFEIDKIIGKKKEKIK